MHNQQWFQMPFEYGESGISYDWIIIEPTVGERYILMQRVEKFAWGDTEPVEWEPVCSWDLRTFSLGDNFE